MLKHEEGSGDAARKVAFAVACLLPLAFVGLVARYESWFDAFGVGAGRLPGSGPYAESLRMLWVIASAALTVVIGCLAASAFYVGCRRYIEGTTAPWLPLALTILLVAISVVIASDGPPIKRVEGFLLEGVKDTKALPSDSTDREAFGRVVKWNTRLGAVSIALTIGALIWLSYQALFGASGERSKTALTKEELNRATSDFRVLFFMGACVLAVAAFEVAVLAKWSEGIQASRALATGVGKESELRALASKAAVTFGASVATAFTFLLLLAYTPCYLALARQHRLNGLDSSPLGKTQVTFGVLLPLIGALAASLTQVLL